LVDEDNKTVKSPLYAYLPVLVGMFVSILISLSAEIKSSKLKYIYDLMKSCKTGAATCLISGISKGYFYTFWPMVAIAPFGFLCYFWLDNLGVGLGMVGFGMFIPYYMNVNLYHSIMNCASMISFVSKAV
jgi:K(+)-stimulated pyrophosphate-energized sodium pump